MHRRCREPYPTPVANAPGSPTAPFAPRGTTYADTLAGRSRRGLPRALGWFSIGLGLPEVLAPRAMAQLTGVRQPKLLQAYGVREIICGVGILTSDQPAGWLAARVAGDALDLVTTGAAVTKGGG